MRTLFGVLDEDADNIYLLKKKIKLAVTTDSKNLVER